MEKNINQPDSTLEPELFALIKEGQLEKVSRYLDLHPDQIELKNNSHSHTPLILAVGQEDYPMVNLLLERGADVNANLLDFYTPLLVAKTFRMAKLLIDHGAIPCERDLSIATHRDEWEKLDLLLTHGKNLEPPYLSCQSVKAVQVYQKHGVDISRSQNSLNLLHLAAENENTELFDYAFGQGAQWEKDRKEETPYYIARHKPKMLTHLQEHYPEYVARRFTPIANIEELVFEPVTFIRKIQGTFDQYLVLSHRRNTAFEDGTRLVRYQLTGTGFRPVQGIELESPAISNFTFNLKGDLFVPTSDNRLLILDPLSFELLEEKVLEEYFSFSQITYLPKRDVFLAVNPGMEMFILDSELNLILRYQYLENIDFYPLVNGQENLLLYYGCNEHFFYELYTLDEQLTLQYIGIVSDSSQTGIGSCLAKTDEVIKALGSVLQCQSVVNGQLQTLWEKQLDDYIYGVCYIGNDRVAVLKEDRILLFHSQDGSLLREVAFDIPDSFGFHHSGLYYDRYANRLIIVTGTELIPVQLEDN